MTDIEITSEYITLAAFLKLCGACQSGGEAKEEILAGAVTVDGQSCTMKGKKLHGGETVNADGCEYRVYKKCI
ncbi:MAG: RNA-binding S4 domain-containing protein [Oscillospiraceae bacterium]